ncbi:MAG: N-acetylmuramoyl-L-alanine amidase [Oscillospiraceae bacterium]|nr:N-acetylmuramoyl-L-alanine amidase [Oscillospiraceae bacterium]
MKVYISPEWMVKFSDNTFESYGFERERMEAISKELCLYLIQKGVSATVGDLSIGTDKYEYVHRNAEAKKGNYDLYICLHSNANNTKSTGPQTFHKPNDDNAEELASYILNSLHKLYTETFPNAVKRPVLPSDEYLELNGVNMPVVLVEIAFHDNKDDAQWIVDNQTRITHTIGNTIYDYIQQKNSFVFPPRPKREVYISPDNQEEYQLKGFKFSKTERERMEGFSRIICNGLVRVGISAKLGSLRVEGNEIGTKRRIRESNEMDYDLHVCIHARRPNGKLERGPEVFILPGDETARKVAQDILDELYALYREKFPDIPKGKVIETTKSQELNGVIATAVLIKIACQNDKHDIDWMSFEKWSIEMAIERAIIKNIAKLEISKQKQKQISKQAQKRSQNPNVKPIPRYYTHKRVWDYDLNKWTKVPIIYD